MVRSLSQKSLICVRLFCERDLDIQGVLLQEEKGTLAPKTARSLSQKSLICVGLCCKRDLDIHCILLQEKATAREIRGFSQQILFWSKF